MTHTWMHAANNKYTSFDNKEKNWSETCTWCD